MPNRSCTRTRPAAPRARRPAGIAGAVRYASSNCPNRSRNSCPRNRRARNSGRSSRLRRSSIHPRPVLSPHRVSCCRPTNRHAGTTRHRSRTPRVQRPSPRGRRARCGTPAPPLRLPTNCPLHRRRGTPGDRVRSRKSRSARSEAPDSRVQPTCYSLTEMITRRTFLTTVAATPLAAQPAEPIIDIHQHTNYTGRTDEELIRHQRDMRIAKTVPLPASSKYGLAAGCGGNDTVVPIARRLPKEYIFFANELPDIPETLDVLQKYLKMGAIGIGEQKFPVEADSPHLVAKIAEEHRIPVLLHFEFKNYNLNFDASTRSWSAIRA